MAVYLCSGSPLQTHVPPDRRLLADLFSPALSPSAQVWCACLTSMPCQSGSTSSCWRRSSCRNRGVSLSTYSHGNASHPSSRVSSLMRCHPKPYPPWVSMVPLFATLPHHNTSTSGCGTKNPFQAYVCFVLLVLDQHSGCVGRSKAGPLFGSLLGQR